jgi:deferrochelatase/peroxidase EfeB
MQLYQLDTAMLPTTRTHFGYRDGLSNPLIEGSGSPGLPGRGPAIKAGEFILGYRDELGHLPPMPQPEVLGRNGTYVAFRKVHTHVARSSASTYTLTQRALKKRSCCKQSSWVAGRAVPCWCLPRSGTIPS